MHFSTQPSAGLCTFPRSTGRCAPIPVHLADSHVRRGWLRDLSRSHAMADNYYEATGVLVLDHVTPVIRALFSEFRLDADYPGNGEAYIALRSDSTPSWDDLRETLTDLATSLALTPSPDTLTPFGEVLKVLSDHFCAGGNAALASMIQRDDFGDAADLNDLFLLATCFDDGHHLREIRFEGSWRCDKLLLFEFGGAGHYMSREFALDSASSDAPQLGVMSQ
ncbi:hypothetical protein CQB05_18085 [Paracidovorax citrulli]|uniref:Uncharacterized protein n=2 Tax=Paracidovorax citrulli TaxID=80869 RepID=A1TJL7_PARC0|nr:hypothetical protein Aave_0550 [Paracidovorax citrulli AAC00-1]ATG95704.1 hypothetical protein CQB05_18085 [Paracidovorax citrulli]